MAADLPRMKGTFYVMSVVCENKRAKMRVDSDGNVEFIGFTPDVDSRELFEIIAKNAAFEWRLRAGYEVLSSVYNVKPKT